MHHAQHIKIFINFFLNRALCNPVIIHMTHLCDQNVLDQLLKISIHHTLLQMSHLICTTQHDRFAI